MKDAVIIHKCCLIMVRVRFELIVHVSEAKMQLFQNHIGRFHCVLWFSHGFLSGCCGTSVIRSRDVSNFNVLSFVIIQ